MGKVIAVCTSDRKGIQKKDVSTAHFSTEWGIDGDAHAGKWHRQISLLSADKIEAFNKRGANVIPGAFGENLVVEGFDMFEAMVRGIREETVRRLFIVQVRKEQANRTRAPT